LEAGASIDLEICMAEGRCHGHVCVCPDASTHSLYECTTLPAPNVFGSSVQHEHKWTSAKSILIDYFKIPESELLQCVARTNNSSVADLLQLARNADAAWKRNVKECFRKEISVLDHFGRYSWIAKTECQRKETVNYKTRGDILWLRHDPNTFLGHGRESFSEWSVMSL
jgi:hypothetical protein